MKVRLNVDITASRDVIMEHAGSSSAAEIQSNVFHVGEARQEKRACLVINGIGHSAKSVPFPAPRQSSSSDFGG